MNNQPKLTRTQILNIRFLLRRMTMREIAVKYNVHIQAIKYQVRKLRERGYKIPRRGGRISKLDK